LQQQRKIEFVGDSITCGFGDEGANPDCPFTAATENNYRTYGSLTSLALNADLHLEAWSGKGVVRNYGDKNITSINPFPIYFPRTLANDNLSNWNFSSWIPDAVVINLGTNDYSTPPQPPQNVFEEGYKKFIASIQVAYASTQQLPIFLVCGPLIGNPCCSYVQNVATELGLYYIDLQNILTYPEDYGCAGHPNVIGHQKMYNITSPFIQKVLNW